VAIGEASDYYRVLRVDPAAEPEVINAAYRKLAAMYHPDVDTSPDAAARMVEINQAYGILKDPDSRAAYDRARGMANTRRPVGAPGGAVPATGGSGFEGVARAIMMMVVSSLIVTFVLESFTGPGGKWLAIVVIGGLLLWKGGPILRYFSGKG
jgi:DnaJ-class molecular chaperone